MMTQATDNTFDELFRALADPQRRQLLRQLRDQQIGDGRNHVSTATISAALDVPEDRALLELHHRHVPLLESAGLLERPAGRQADGGVDSEPADDDRRLAPGPQFDRAMRILAAVTEHAE